MQRDYILGYPLQDVQDWRAIHKTFGCFLISKQGFDFPSAHSEAVRIDRNGLTVFEQIGCAFQSQNCRHAEFSGHIGEMSGRRPLFGDKGRGPVEKAAHLGSACFTTRTAPLGKRRTSLSFLTRKPAQTRPRDLQ